MFNISTKTMLTRLVLPVALSVLAGSASASLVMITANGTYSSSAPTTGLSKANEAYALSFEVQSPTTAQGAGIQSVIDALFTLNGVKVGNVTGVTFYPTSEDGLFDVTITGAGSTTLLDFYGPQIYGTGGVLLTGNYTGVVDEGQAHLPAGIGGAKLTVSTVAEPGTLAGVGIALVALAAARRKQKRG
ncbi:PEP-CTERM sorting domain-containing protein [Scleromatobacter humisilvae]|uniref:PEP-CTERM sorting domain-containing protein n=1 Tax=Scleromatobacter humisilvae TaxID=2897159 RepID=A0A9X1YLJ0_9BURK|nr:PEP-CTERM sorting domain-containing protein [Scleromatobacter humisilvae]MCK9686587.1 PEP-CTERM sorting domain-containing protein [Scleromatobacter humisilvae]